jgi:protein tyrosine phosphatase
LQSTKVNLNTPEDFVDASYVGDTFIAAGAPLLDNFRNWFAMLYEKCSIVVMVTPYIESGRLKATNYLANDVRYDDFHVATKVVEEDPTNEIVVTEMIIRKHDSCDEIVSERTIYHIHYNRWTDQHIPDHIEFKALNDMYAKYLQFQEKDLNTGFKTCVHCSAGVGRTGTFIAIQHLLRDIKSQTSKMVLDVVDQVRQLRKERFGMVQTEIQFMFIYDYIKNALSMNNLN